MTISVEISLYPLSNEYIPTIETFIELEKFIEDNKAGWYHELIQAGGGEPSTRNLSKGGVVGGAVAYADFTPSSELCEPLGMSGLNVVYYKTGTGHPGVLVPELVDGAGITGTRLDLGAGRAMEPVFHSGTGGGEGVTTILTNNSNLSVESTEINLTGEPGFRTSWHEIFVND